MNESFQIIATLVAAQLVLGMAQGPRATLVATARPDRALAAALGRWPLELLWASIALAIVVGLGNVASPDVHLTLRVICGGHLALLGAVAVRRSFSQDRPSSGAARRVGAVLTDPGTLPAYLSLFAITDAGALGDAAQILTVLALPTLTLVWTALIALAMAPTTDARARLRTRRDRRSAARLPLRLRPVTAGRG